MGGTWKAQSNCTNRSKENDTYQSINHSYPKCLSLVKLPSRKVCFTLLRDVSVKAFHILWKLKFLNFLYKDLIFHRTKTKGRGLF